MKLSTVKHNVEQDEESVDVPIEGKDGEAYLAADGSPSTISVVGSESRQVKRVVDAQIKRAIRRQTSKVTPDLLREERVEKAVAAVTNWHGWEDDDGTAIPCTPENVTALLNSADHVLEQVEAGIRRHASFFATRSAS